MAHLNQGYRHAHAVYGSAIASMPQKEDIENEQQRQAFTKAIKSIQGTLENPHEYYETFVIKEILKVGEAYALLRAEITKWSRLKNRPKANAKNKELGIYVTVLQDTHMYKTLGKLLSPTVGHTKTIQAAAAKTLALIAFRPNKYRDAEWYHKKQKMIALHKFSIGASVYTVLLLLSHILMDGDDLQCLNVRCYALQLLSNLVNHNSDVIIAINKQFSFLCTILKLLNNAEFFEMTLKRDDKRNKTALSTLMNGLNALLNMIEHNEANRMQFCEERGWNLICKCLTHPCVQIRQLSLCFIHNLSISSKLCAKYFLNTTFNGTQSFKILLNMMTQICASLKSNENENQTELRKDMHRLLSTLICALSSLCNDNMIGYKNVYIYKSWKMIGTLLETVRHLESVSNALHLQIFALLSCFNVPTSFEKWKETQWNLMFNLNEMEIGRKLTMKQRKLKQKKDEITQENEYKKTQRMCKEIIRMFGGYIIETEEEETQDRNIVLRYLFENLSKTQFVVGAMCALGKLCKLKHNGNIIRLDQMIEISKKENINKYKASLKGLKNKMNQKFTKCPFSNSYDLNELVYFVSALNDLFDVIINDEHKSNGKHIRETFIESNVIYTLCMVITQPSNKYLSITKQKQIGDLKLNACYALANVIKYDAKMQTLFGHWIQRVCSSLKDLAIDPADNCLLQMALTYVIESACFKPPHNDNIKQMRSFNVQHLLMQLHKQIQVTTAISK